MLANFKAINFTRENLVYLLVLLFPVLGVSVRHWNSGLFVLVCLFSLVCLKKRDILNLPLRLKLLSAFFIAYSILGIYTSSQYGFDEFVKNNYLEEDVRFLLLAPLLLLFGRHRASKEYLYLGILAANFIALIHALIDRFYFGYEFAGGVYGYGYFGGVTAITSCFALAGLLNYTKFEHVKIKKSIVVASYLAGFVACMLSISQVSMLILTVLSFLIVYKAVKRKAYYVYSLILFLTIFFIFLGSSELMRARLLRTFDVSAVESYIKSEDKSKIKIHSSLIERLEMWRATLIISKNNQYSGVGAGKYYVYINKLASDNIINPFVATHGHPHNIFMESLVTRGFLGVILLLAIFVILFDNCKKKNGNNIWRQHLLLHILAILIIGSFESAPVNKGNFVAIFLIYIAAFSSKDEKSISRESIV